MPDIEQMSEEFSSITLEDVNQAFYQEIDEFSQDINSQMNRIKYLINSLIVNMELYQSQVKMLPEKTIAATMQKLQLKKDLIYKDFFELQNLINLFIYQKVIMTYVHVDPITGQRELRIFDNDISQLEVKTINNYGRSYAKLGYDIAERYQQLKNSLSDQENSGLQATAAEVEARYVKYKGRILWKINNEWVGYKLYNRGPINEAFTAFYLKEVQLNNSLGDNVHQFMTSVDPQGVIYADNANGFLIGDISLGGLQFAVKGAYGSPQNFTTIINWLKKIRDQNFSFESFQEFIQRFKEIEQEKATKLVKPLTKRSIDSMIRYHGDKLLEPLSNLTK